MTGLEPTTSRDGPQPGGRLSGCRKRIRLEASPPWRQIGDEPDYRFSLANERTFLAWIRTSLALMASAIAVMQLVHSLGVEQLRYVLGLLLALMGLLLSASAYRRWEAIERAMRERRPLPHSSLFRLLAVGLTIVAILVVGVVVVS